MKKDDRSRSSIQLTQFTTKPTNMALHAISKHCDDKRVKFID